MAIKTLKFTARFRWEGSLRINLPLESQRDFVEIKSRELPAAYVIRARDLKKLADFKDHVIDRGSKHRAKGLSRYLLGRKKIPLIKGSYTSSGQLKRSVRTLLSNAVEANDKNVFIIGVNEEIFIELWEQATTHLPSARKTGAKISLFKPDPGKQLLPGETGVSSLLMEMLADEKVEKELVENYIGDSLKIRLVRALVTRAARNDEPVLILGDTGTGKEIVARYIHKLGQRCRQTFVPVNCAAIPRELLESELFGHKKGAFTSAFSDKVGLWQVADRGTLFLDEIADLAPEHQAKILRCLEEGAIRRVGDEREIRVDVRILAASNRDLYSLIQDGSFREDLYYRLRSFLIHTPSLQDCPEDILSIAQFLWIKITKDRLASLPGEILSALPSYYWPGNVRELKAVLTNLYTLFGMENLGFRHLQMIMRMEQPETHLREKAVSEEEINLHRVECLRHLRKSDEVIRACQITLRPLERDRRTDRRTIEMILPSLRLRLEELEVLCLHPLLFHNEKAFFVINRFKGKLSRLYHLLQTDVRAASRFWKSELSGEFKTIIQILFKEVERLLENR